MKTKKKTKKATKKKATRKPRLATRCFTGGDDEFDEVEPLSNQVLLKRIDAPTHTPTGIVLPTGYDAAMDGQNKTLMCSVLKVGPGKISDKGVRKPMEVKEGDIAIVSIFGVTDIVLDTKPYFVAPEDEILAVMR